MGAALVGIHKARVFLILAGLAWIAGLQPPLLTRLAIALLVAVAITGEGFLEQHQPAPPTPTRT
ncbi:hypothetical protein ACFY7H_13065 [Streptomyces sp. NPDC012794]|uniref:hypothetical protein n=1 Tax=Streptomyces sp. NPDC012794 TaxID=3364850 RepID=UPI0036A5A3AD